MPLLIPNSFGTADRRIVREFNPHHEPAGSAKGGQFARVPGGGASTGAQRGKKVKKLELTDWAGKAYDPAVARKVLGREATTTTLDALAEDMLRDVEGVGFSVKVKTAEMDGQPALMVRFEGDDGDPKSVKPDQRATILSRTFVRDRMGNLNVTHNGFEKNRTLPPGFGKDMLRSHMLTYEQMGVKRIDTFANIETGAYAWAKYGFLASDVDDAGTTLEQLAENYHGRTVGERDFLTGEMKGKTVGIGDHEVREMKRIARSLSPTKVWEFADMTVRGVKVGKTLLTDGDQGWEAYLNVKGDDALSVKARERFWSYVGRTKAPRTTTPRTREVAVVLIEAKTGKQEPGELCEWNGTRYTDGRMWDAMLNGDTAYFYELTDPAGRAAYRAGLP